MAINLDAESVRTEAFENPKVWGEHAAMIESLSDEVIDGAIRECVDDHFWAAFASARSGVINRLINENDGSIGPRSVEPEPVNTMILAMPRPGKNSGYFNPIDPDSGSPAANPSSTEARSIDHIARIIDRVKTDERNLDTDRYVGMVLDALETDLRLVWIATVVPWIGVESGVSTTVHASYGDAWAAVRDNHDPEGDLRGMPNDELGDALGLTIIVHAHEVPTS